MRNFFRRITACGDDIRFGHVNDLEFGGFKFLYVFSFSILILLRFS